MGAQVDDSLSRATKAWWTRDSLHTISHAGLITLDHVDLSATSTSHKHPTCDVDRLEAVHEGRRVAAAATIPSQDRSNAIRVITTQWGVCTYYGAVGNHLTKIWHRKALQPGGHQSSLIVLKTFSGPNEGPRTLIHQIYHKNGLWTETCILHEIAASLKIHEDHVSVFYVITCRYHNVTYVTSITLIFHSS